MQAQSINPEGVQGEKHLFSGELHYSKTANEVKVSEVSFETSELTFQKLHAFRQSRIILCLDSANEGLVHEMISECSAFCKEFDTLKQREKKTNVACIMPSGEIIDADGVGAVELLSKFEESK